MRDLVGPPPCATRVRDYGAPQVSHASPRGSFAASRLASLASPNVARHGALASLAVHGVVRRPPSTVGRPARHMARVASAALITFLVIACTSLMIVARTEKPAPRTISGTLLARSRVKYRGFAVLQVSYLSLIVTLLIFFFFLIRVEMHTVVIMICSYSRTCNRNADKRCTKKNNVIDVYHKDVFSFVDDQNGLFCRHSRCFLTM